jgi:dolichyl-phosphate-mannose-protein mannosyltransferase
LLGKDTAGTEQAPQRAEPDAFRLERRLALAGILIVAAYFRMRDPLYNTAYMDESVYVVYGRMFLAHHFESPLSTPLQWTFGWYLWPAMAALADRVAGLVGLRELAAVLGTLTVAATYGFASRVFSKTTGLAAAAIMALLGPAILISRIATRDSGSVCFFALALWAFASAWQENKKRYWALAAALLLAAFLCKYLVAVYFPALVILALFKGRKPALLFALPLTAACAAYWFLHSADLLHLLRYGSGYGSLRAPEPYAIYIFARWDFWLVAWFSLVAFGERSWRARAGWMFAGALLMMAVQWQTRADFDYWKHVNYALLFLAPAAAAGVLFLVRQFLPKNYGAQLTWGTTAVVVLALAAGWFGKVQHFNQFIFWPNVDPALAYFEGRLTPQDRVLVDDTVFRYYFHPPLGQGQITDPMYVAYHDSSGSDLRGDDAYKAAVAEKAFSYIVLNGGMGEEAQRMNAAARPVLGGYQLELKVADPVLGHTIEIYARRQDAAASGAAAPDVQQGDALPANGAPGIRIVTPASRAVVSQAETALEGRASGVQAGWFVRVEVFTDRWHPQGEAVAIAADGTFRQKILLAGEGPQQCNHLVRARLLDTQHKSRAVTMNTAIGRAGGNCFATEQSN